MTNRLFSRIGLSCLLIIFSIATFRCSHTAPTAAALPSKLVVSEPFENIKVAGTSYKIDARTGGSVTTKTGTRINVPAGAFVDKNGNPVAGEVELSFREFHSPVEIIASGIPMEYIENGKVMNFESAGMFEIKGYSAGQELEIAGGKELDIQLASYKPGNDFNFYVFNTEKGRWEELSKNLAADENTAKKETLARLASQPLPAKPIEPQKTDENATVINLDVNYALYPHMKEFNGLLWQYAGADESNDPKNNPDVFEANWKHVDLTPAAGDETGSLFNLTIKTQDKTYTAVMKPVLKGKNFEKARQKFIQQRKEFLEVAEARANEQQRAQREGDFMRSLQVGSFGIYNCDRFYADNVSFALNWDYTIDGPVDKSQQRIYHICKTDNSVVYYYPNTKQLKFDPDKENCLVAILPGDKVAVFDSEDFKDLNKKGLRKGAAHNFHFTTLDRTFKNTDDLDQLLGNL